METIILGVYPWQQERYSIYRHDGKSEEQDSPAQARDESKLHIRAQGEQAALYGGIW